MAPHRPRPTPSLTALTMNSALDKLYNELLNEAGNEEPEEITDAEKAKRFLEEKQVTIEKLREVRMCRRGACVGIVCYPRLNDKDDKRRVLALKDALGRETLYHTTERISLRVWQQTIVYSGSF